MSAATWSFKSCRVVDSDAAEKRFRRALLQRDEYSCELRPDGGATVRNVRTGKEYEVDALGACSCPDWLYRCSKSGERCKHGVCVALLRLERGL